MSERLAAAFLVVLNTSLALLVQSAAPSFPRHTDLREYEYVGRHAFAPNCPVSIYCYRVLVPLVLERLPGDRETRWRSYQVSATAAAGTLVSLVTLQAGGGFRAALMASVLVQTSYGFSFTAYDPYTADPIVFVFAAFIAWCWFEDRWRLALVAGLIGVFAKETVALVSVTCLLAALVRDRATWRAWVASGVTVAATVLAFHWVMDTYFGWGVGTNPAAELSAGSWLAVWWHNNPFLGRKLYLLFAPFGFAWLFAVMGYRIADARLRRLAIAAIVPFAALCYLQTPERALSNAFFVVVPLAALLLSRAPFALALAAAVANGAVTAKIGSSTMWLPPSGYLMIPTVLLTTFVLAHGYLASRQVTSALTVQQPEQSGAVRRRS